MKRWRLTSGRARQALAAHMVESARIADDAIIPAV
jgi:hypothetical protein